MGVGTLISVEEYLNTPYDPDVEFVDSVLVDRNVGTWRHSLVQRNLILAFAKFHKVWAVPELRVRTSNRRYRIPDVTVVLTPPESDVLLEGPFVAIEILSDKDTVSETVEKLEEYAALGTRHIWVFDPRRQKMFTFREGALREIYGETIATDEPRLEVTRADIFQR